MTDVTMRAKMVVSKVEGNDTSQRLFFRPVYPKAGYPADGTDENNSFAKWTPQADLNMTVNNPALLGKFKEGDTFYVDFTPAPQ